MRLKKRGHSKKGVAMVMALIVVFLVMVLATSYLGITMTGNKTAKNYRSEASALTFAQTGLDMAINFMGRSGSWRADSSGLSVLNVDALESYLTNEELLKIIGVKSTGGIKVKAFDGAVAIGMLEKWFGSFLSVPNLDNNPVPYQIFFFENAFRVPPDRQGILVMAVIPEGLNGGDIVRNSDTGLVRDNVNYTVGIVSLVYDSGANIADIINDIKAKNLPSEASKAHLVSSRMIKVRTSHVFPGSIYQNLRAYDAPSNPRANIFGVFGYPNFHEGTADASFIDENSTWDGGIRADGHLRKDEQQAWGAPALNGNMNALGGNANSFVTQEVGNIYDTSGSIKISFLDKRLEEAYRNGDSVSQKAKELGLKMTKFNSILSTQQKRNFGRSSSVVYQRMTTGEVDSSSANLTKLTGGDGITSNTSVLSQGRDGTSNATDSIWNLTKRTDSGAIVEESKLSFVKKDNSGNLESGDGLFSKMTRNNSNFYYRSYSSSDYKPDKLYSNTKMEVPTIRVTIQNSGNNDQTYRIDRIDHVLRDNGVIEEISTNLDTKTAADIPGGVMYFSGANVQVKGEFGSGKTGAVTKPLTIVADTNPNVDVANANGTGNFSSLINAPNIRRISDGKFLFLDAQLKNGIYDVNDKTPVNTTPKKYLMSQANLAEEKVPGNDSMNLLKPDGTLADGYEYVFPQSNEHTEQAAGNISVIGDLSYQKGSNASLALVAKNRVYLNDFTHKETAPEAFNPNMPKEGDNVLKLDAVVASERHNMTMDFYNASKNIDYAPNRRLAANDPKLGYPPGYRTDAGAAPPTTGSTTITNSNPYRVILSQNLANALHNTNNPQRVRDSISFNSTGTSYLNRYLAMDELSKRMVWNDYYMGAVRVFDDPELKNGNITVYSGGRFDFSGAVLSRFADIEADAGIRSGDGRIQQMGYPIQQMSFDSNLLDRSAPYFSTTNTSLNRYTDIIRWSILTYVDRGNLFQR